jgi:hypothetical protein
MKTPQQFSMRQLLLFVAFSAAALACYEARLNFRHDDGFKYYAFHLLFGACFGAAAGALLGRTRSYALAGLIAGALLAIYDVMIFRP